MKIFIWLFTSYFLSCKGPHKFLPIQNVQEENIQLTLLLRDNYSGFETPGNRVIDNQKDLRDLFSKINKTRKPGLPIPEVDFSQETAILYYAGVQTDGILPSLQFVAETDGEMVFACHLEHLKQESPSSASITPFCIYKMPLTSKQIIFQDPE